MKEIQAQAIVTAVRDLAIEANTQLGDDVVRVLSEAAQREESPTGKDILLHLIRNAEISRGEGVPLCQDTGLAVVFVDVGQDVRVVGGDIRAAVNEGVRQGYQEGYLRKSVKDFFTGENTGDNTPAIVHFDIVPGDTIRIAFMAKGGGSENMSRAASIIPAAGVEGIRRFVVDTIREAGGNPCPPTIIGIGIGGSLEYAALMAKRALLRPVGSPNPDERVARMEQQWLVDINELGIGPQGLGGNVTSLAVHILVAPHHIAGIPVAVNIQCHSSRHKEVVL